MKPFKIAFFSILLLLSLFLMVACTGKADETIGLEGSSSDNGSLSYTPNPDPELIDLNENEGSFLGIGTETVFDQVTATTSSATYSLSQDSSISCTIQNGHVGHGFAVYGAVYIDKYIDGEWVRQCNKKALEEQAITLWHFVGEENGADTVMSSRRGLLLSDIDPEPTPGKYRLVFFTPVRPVYAEFELIE